MPAEKFRKLKANIASTGKYPAIIVRTLGKSKDFKDLASMPGPVYQIIDGEHRFKICRDLKHDKIYFDNWGDLTDEQVHLYLLTLNHLRGADVKKRRATLLSIVRGEIGDADAMAELVPENVSQIESSVAQAFAEPVTEDEVVERGAACDPWVCLLSDEMKRVVNAACRLRMSKGELPGESLPANEFTSVIGDYQKGRAIYAICADYILRNKEPENV